MINLDFKSGRSLHQQIETGIKELIIGKILKADDKLPSVRELSVSLTVNPNTVQRAYKQLETDGFIYSVKAKGNFVAPLDEDDSAKRIKELLFQLEAPIKELKFLGLEKEELIKTVSEIFSGEEGEK